MTLAHTCNDEAQESRDEQNDPFRITRHSTQDSDDNDAPHHEITDLKEDCKGQAEDEQCILQLEQ